MVSIFISYSTTLEISNTYNVDQDPCGNEQLNGTFTMESNIALPTSMFQSSLHLMIPCESLTEDSIKINFTLSKAEAQITWEDGGIKNEDGSKAAMDLSLVDFEKFWKDEIITPGLALDDLVGEFKDGAINITVGAIDALILEKLEGLGVDFQPGERTFTQVVVKVGVHVFIPFVPAVGLGLDNNENGSKTSVSEFRLI